MARRVTPVGIAWAVIALCPGVASALTRDLADMPAFRLTFGQSVLNQLTYDTYRNPFDELQTRPYNLLFANIARQPNLSPWPGQQGSYARYVDALIGNNGAANVDNDADAIEGSLIRRETGTKAWGLSAAILAGTVDSQSANATGTISRKNDLKGLDLRGAAAFQLGERRVLGAGLRAILATHDDVTRGFEPGVGGSYDPETFQQLGLRADVGLRQFVGAIASWEAQAVVGYGNAEQDDFSETIDDTGNVTDRFVSTNYDIDELSLGVLGSYNRLRPEGLGEVEYRGGLTRSQRKLGNSNLSYRETGGVTTPSVTLLAQDPVATTELFVSARSIFQAGETEMFLGGRLGYAMIGGQTRYDAAGTIVTEEIDDSETRLGLTLGLRQPLFRDKLRIVVSGRGDVVGAKTATTFDTGSAHSRSTLSAAQYAVGLEAVLANVTLDLAWLAGEEASVVSPEIGLPSGSRRTVQVDRLVFSAAVSW